jgi:hypothetical protein
MSLIALNLRRGRGTELLLAHCGALSRPSASERLSAELGSDFSVRLVRALAKGQGADRRRRSSSSP